MSRRRPTRVDLALDIADLRNAARHYLPNICFEFIEGGAEDELTLRRNRAAFESVAFVPRALVDVARRNLEVPLFGKPVAAPLAISPMGVAGWHRRGADMMIARACKAAGIPYTLSTSASTRLEDMAEQVGGRLWMQLYALRDPAAMTTIAARANAAGYEALVLTVDTPVAGIREWDMRNFVTPTRPTWRNRLGVLMHPRWMLDVLRHGLPRLPNVEELMPPDQRSGRAGRLYVAENKDPSLTLESVKRLREMWPRTLMIKGILSPEDVDAVAGLGVDAVILSNHGGRQLDSAVSAFEMLPRAVQAAAGRLAILLDGGVRRGADIIKARALGAAAVMMGRPALFGAAAGGEAGAARAIQIITAEASRTLALIGVPDIRDVGPQHLTAAAPCPPLPDRSR
ncbi:MAG: alpha-hydroxy-acid oxidizing protein [Alphaproteobacteria bacterium]|nr:alpha-hydroxy-acid oxidizing protein [Alphaproteobacteria bacterium]